MDLYRLAEALQIIKSACKDAPSCGLCPMGDRENKCLVKRVDPEDWDIKTPDIIPRIMRWPTFSDEE